MQTERTISHNGEILVHEATVAPDPASSVEIATNAKGQAQVTVKVYDSDPAAAAAKAVALYRQVTAAVSQAAEAQARGSPPLPGGEPGRTAGDPDAP